MTKQLWIDGKWVDSNSDMMISIENPATGEEITETAEATPADVDRAVQAARAAFDDGPWSQMTGGERSQIIWRLADLLEARKEEFAKAEADNTGKPYRTVAMGDVGFSIDNLRFFAGAARDTHGMSAGEYAAGHTTMFFSEPVGVVGQIAPWNFPLMMAVWKTGPALAAGCTLVLKPAPTTPLTTLMFAELTKEAGFPAGVVNIITGGASTGQSLVEHPDVNMVSLTGSVGTGKKVMRTAADTLKRVHLELGGKAPFIVFDDADVEAIAQSAASNATVNSGQVCVSATRVYVEQSKFNAVTEAVVEAMRAVKTGQPYDDGVDMGPLISGPQRERVQGFVARAERAGAHVLTGGRVPAGFGNGYYFEPTVIVDADQRSEIIQSEVFGPVLTINRFQSEGEAIRLANDVIYGLAASVWTQGIGRALRLTKRLEFGIVWVNSHMTGSSEGAHGGFKQSGFGKDLSVEAVADYKRTKNVTIKHT